MNLKYKFWSFRKAIPDRICDAIIRYGRSLPSHKGVVGGLDMGEDPSADKKDKLLKTRNAEIAWFDELWICNELFPYIKMANKNANWNFQWDWTEATQFTMYKKGYFYTWHKDGWDEPYPTLNQETEYKANPDRRKGKIRKLSSILALNDATEFKGGEVEVDFDTKRHPNEQIVTCEDLKYKGSLIVFPSDVWHRVTPVTEGKRFSLVSWYLGQPYV